VSPGSIHPETGLEYKVVRRVDIVPVPDAFIKWLVSKKNGEQKDQAAPTPTPAPALTGDAVKDGIAAIFAAGVTIPEHGRNVGLTSVAGKFRNLGLGPAEVEEQLLKYNERFCVPPLPASEVHTISNSIGNRPVLDKDALVPLIGGQKITGAIISISSPGAIPQLVEGVSENGIKAEGPINMTEVGNARRLIQAYGKNIRFCVDDDLWRLYDGNLWVVDKEKLVKYWMKCVLTDIQKDADNVFTSVIPKEIRESLIEKTTQAGKLREDADVTESELPWVSLFLDAQALRRWAITSESNKNVVGSTEQAKTEPPMPTRNKDFDANRLICNVKNGTLEFNRENASFVFREHRREDFCTRMAPVDYVPGADCPQFKAFLRWMFGGDEELIQFIPTFFGLCLTGLIDRIILILYGDGANGKGTLVKIISKLLGSDRSGYGTSVSFSTFSVGKEESAGGPRADLVSLDGPRLAVASESDKRKTVLNLALLKGLTGDDPTKTRGMYAKEMIEYEAQCKILLLTNNLFKVEDDSEGAWERMKFVPCLQHLPPAKQDKMLAERIFKQEASGILNLLLECLVTYFRRQNQGLSGFQIPKAVEKATESYRGTENHIAQFTNDKCEIKPQTYSTLSSIIYEKYKEWCATNGEQAQSNRAMTEFLIRRHKVEIKPKRDGKHLLGITLKPQVFTASDVTVTVTQNENKPDDLPLFDAEEVPI
jgi:putative DNA primase/helicase